MSNTTRVYAGSTTELLLRKIDTKRRLRHEKDYLQCFIELFMMDGSYVTVDSILLFVHDGFIAEIIHHSLPNGKSALSDPRPADIPLNELPPNEYFIRFDAIAMVTPNFCVWPHVKLLDILE